MQNLPKGQLVRSLLINANIEDLRNYFRIQAGTSLETRLLEFSKAALLRYINDVGGRLLNLVRAEADNFPLKASPTMYVVSISNPIDFDEMERISLRLRGNLRNDALILPNERAIRAVYVRRELIQVRNVSPVFEIILGYEKRIEITESDPENQNYGAVQNVYSLENALVWFPERERQFAIISCSDFSAITPILSYLNMQFRLRASLPDLSQAMLQRIAEGGQVRNATFSHVYGGRDEDIDVRTITFYDTDLQNRRVFQEMCGRQDREQRAGFYNQHPGILRAGIGITRRYGRIWTPAHLNRDELLRLALGIITNLNTELERAAAQNLHEFTGYYSNTRVVIGNTSLTGKSRNIFDALIRYLIVASRLQERRFNVSREDIISFVELKSRLGMTVTATYECPQCGTRNYKCPSCNADIEVIYERDIVIFSCPSCNNVIDFDNYSCDCGEICPTIDPLSHLFIYPSIELLNAIEEYMSHLHPAIVNPGLFVIVGTEACLLANQQNPNAQRVNLDELEMWRNIGRFHLHHPIQTGRLIRILGQAKEKCDINNWHPRRTDCERCIRANLTARQLENGQVCLLRAFGIPIQQEFDGIHHGNEIADIIYTDRLNGQRVHIGIHFKSKANSNPPRGLGRTNDKIRELYTQVYYTLYKITQGDERFDIIGISIPNRVSADVINSVQSVLFRFGVSFIILDHDMWIRIISLVRDNLLFNQ
jgi:hypothetical protein